MRQPEQLGIQAGYLYLMMARGLATQDTAVRWADGWIAASERPSEPLLELSISVDWHQSMHHLQAIAGQPIPQRSLDLSLSRVGQLLSEGGCLPDEAARHVAALLELAGDRSSNFYWQVLSLADDLEPGVVRDQVVFETICGDFVTLLRPYKSLEPELCFAA